MHWITLSRTHINLDNITVFKWVDHVLYIWDGSDESFELDDENKELYHKLCNACCMNMVEE